MALKPSYLVDNSAWEQRRYVASATGQPHEWIVPRGKGHRAER